jgi:hypothetical protein
MNVMHTDSKVVWAVGAPLEDPHAHSTTASQLDPPPPCAAAGKSGLKHTRQLLECWKRHPRLPHLTIVGDLTPNPDEMQWVHEAPNMKAYPAIRRQGDDVGAADVGGCGQPQWPRAGALAATLDHCRGACRGRVRPSAGSSWLRLPGPAAGHSSR